MTTRRLDIKGLAELEQKLLALPGKLAGRALPRALLAGAKPIVEQAKRLAPVGTDRAIVGGIKAKRSRRDKLGPYAARVVIGVEHGFQKQAGRTKRDRYKGDPYYWRFVELGFHAVGRRKSAGRAERRRRRKGKPTYGRFVPGQRFMQRALEQQAELAGVAVTVELKRQIERYL